MQNGGTIAYGYFGLSGPSTGSFIGSGENDGSEFPDFSQVLLTADAGDLMPLYFVWDHNIQIRADTAPGGNSYSFIEYEFQLFVPETVGVYGAELRVMPSPFTTEHGVVTASLNIEGITRSVSVEGTAPVEQLAASGFVTFDPPLYGGTYTGSVFPTGLVFSGTLEVRAEIDQCPVIDTCAALAGVIETGFYLEDPAVFADGFESGDTAAWSSPRGPPKDVSGETRLNAPSTDAAKVTVPLTQLPPPTRLSFTFHLARAGTLAAASPPR